MPSTVLIILFILFGNGLCCTKLAPTAAPIALDWGYLPEGTLLTPDEWSVSYPRCAGDEQSPIALYDDDVIIDAALPPLTFSEGYSEENSHLVLDNDGASLEVVVEENNPYITGGLMGNDKYDLLEAHIHWGPTNSQGSEHTLGDQPASIEIHFVHRKQGLTTEEALNDRTGLSVVAAFFQVSATDQQSNGVMKTITDNAEKVEFKDETHPLPPLRLIDIFPSNRNFVTYLGLLTKQN